MMAYLTTALLLAGAPALQAEDWTMYLRDLSHSSYNDAETTLGVDNAGSLGAGWMKSFEAPLAAAPTYAGGVLYFGDWKGQFHAVDASDGSELWSRFVGMAPTPPPDCSPPLGVSSQAAVLGDAVYVGGGDAAVYALDRATGQLLWRLPVGDAQGGAYVWSSIMVYNGALYLGVASLGDCPLVRGSLIRIDPAAPEQARFAWLAPEGEIGGGIWSTPAIDAQTNTVFVTTGTGEQDAGQGFFGGTFASFDADTLEMKAYYFLPTNSLEDDIEWGSSPTLFTTADGQSLVAATGKDGVLYALRRDDMSLVWQTRLAVSCVCPQCGCGSLSSPAFDGQTLFVGSGVADPELFSGGAVYAIDPGTGVAIWRQVLDGTVIAPVTVANGLLYVPTLHGLLIFDAATGDPVWNDGNFGLLYSQAVVADGTVFCTYGIGDVVAWRPGAGSAPQNPMSRR